MPTPIRSDAQRTHERIFSAATSVLTVDAGAGMDAIAQRAGIGRATLYRHFATREDLVAALRERFIGLVEAAAAASIAEDEPREAIRIFIEGVIRAVAVSCPMSDGRPGPGGEGRTMPAIDAAIQRFMERATTQGSLRPGVDAAWVFIVGKALIEATSREIALGADVDVLAPRAADTVAAAVLH